MYNEIDYSPVGLALVMTFLTTRLITLFVGVADDVFVEFSEEVKSSVDDEAISWTAIVDVEVVVSCTFVERVVYCWFVFTVVCYNCVRM